MDSWHCSKNYISRVWLLLRVDKLKYCTAATASLRAADAEARYPRVLLSRGLLDVELVDPGGSVVIVAVAPGEAFVAGLAGGLRDDLVVGRTLERERVLAERAVQHAEGALAAVDRTEARRRRALAEHDARGEGPAEGHHRRVSHCTLKAVAAAYSLRGGRVAGPDDGGAVGNAGVAGDAVDASDLVVGAQLDLGDVRAAGGALESLLVCAAVGPEPDAPAGPDASRCGQVPVVGTAQVTVACARQSRRRENSVRVQHDRRKAAPSMSYLGKEISDLPGSAVTHRKAAAASRTCSIILSA
ncbi:hypothetical protein JKP88DRAFT_231355 [Tribonema minus]|uniref:Uncharacterized protein n=1 Tax=Tribonema minus TaxID=303371 RepID=A0A835ZBK1_9STRA|nr:hypothetical protein JKP88DRAFT_231355 [Tribonema minus]